jgi:hypothetical protein
MDDLRRKIGTLEKQRARSCGDSHKIATDSNSHRVALATKTGAAMNAPREMPMELIVATFFRTVPTCVRIVREEATDTAEISDATLANVTVALFLFFLPDYVPYSDQENIYKMRHVRFSGCVDDSADWSTVYAHSQLKFRIFLERAAYFERAFNGRFRAMIKNERDAVARRDGEQWPRRFRDVEFISASYDLV